MASVVYVLFIRFRCDCDERRIEIIDYYTSNETDEDFYARVSLDTFDSEPIVPQWALDWGLFGVYVGFILIVVIISVLEKSVYEHAQSNNFFTVFAYIMGVISAASR